MGAKCVVIGKELVIDFCPLANGVCFYKHRLTNKCMYTDKEMSADELAVLVGLSPLSEEEYNSIFNKLKENYVKISKSS